MHIGEIGTRIPLDLASPLAVLATSMLLATLKSDLPSLRKSISVIAPFIAAETKSELPRAWRIDTQATATDHGANTISHWIQGLQEVDASALASLGNSCMSVPASPSSCSIISFESTADSQREYEASSGSCEDCALATPSKTLSHMYVLSLLIFAHARVSLSL